MHDLTTAARRPSQFVIGLLLLLVFASAGAIGRDDVHSTSDSFQAYERPALLASSRSDVLPPRQSVPQASGHDKKSPVILFSTSISLQRVYWHFHGLVSSLSTSRFAAVDVAYLLPPSRASP